MKIIYLHQYFKTPEEGGAIRSWHLAGALAKAGHQVELITAHNKNIYEVKTINGFHVHYLPVPYKNNFGSFRRILSFIRFAKLAYQKAKEFRDADICYASSTPLTVGLAALKLKENFGMPFLFEVRDLWPEAPIQMGVIKNYFVKRYLYNLEKRIYGQAEKIIALSPGIQEGILKVVHGKEVVMIPNMSDGIFFTSEEKSDTLLTKYGIAKDQFVISYTGSLGKANKLEYFLDIAEESAKNHPLLRFIIAGEGSQTKLLKSLAVLKQSNNIIFIESGGKNLMREILNISDATYTSFDTRLILETNSPNKFFDSLAAGKLTIVNTKGWLKELVEENQCGFYADPLDPSDFIKKLAPFLADKNLLKKYQQNARALADKEFSVEELSKTFIKLLKNS
ncbi:MAG TPA: glycosyltransferase family 4 protein [Cytophagaceae bacterium]|jgi:glycosyltransferase involved in cell wall biosynthesis|nr:glycosyltransferase family 4 protein [Cytophagaceae bacterium]